MRQLLRRRTGALYVAASAMIAVIATVALSIIALDDHSLSVVDEHVHLDYAIELDAGTIPHRGSLYTDELLQEWACGVGHDAGPLVHECGSDDLSLADLPSGEYTSGYIHYPTYFLGAVGLGKVLAPFGVDLLDSARLFSALLTGLGIAMCGLMAYMLGLRRSALLAATSIPAATSLVLMLGIAVNPGSTAILSGALVAGFGVRWVKTGRGFGWLAAAGALASAVAVTNSLPLGAFILAIVGAVIARRFGYQLTTPWQPRLLHAVALAAIVIAPVIAWGARTSATATVGNDALYGAYTPRGRLQVATGLVSELFTFHTPWLENGRLLADGTNPVTALMRAAATGLPFWITLLVVGGLLLALLVPRLRARDDELEPPSTSLARPRALDAVVLLVVCALLTIVLYPPALRLSNVFTFAIDNSIVNRYSIAFAPLLTFLVLLLYRNRMLSGALAASGAFSLIAVATARL